ncbi:hypothetical protein GCM10028778_16400 [Barrientosiimonas marina]|uniref:PrgI family protein n=1 Tax=Lentibacillus kimchii TaxID=1542911 RepID=A0ABW2UX34_9BACI
MTFYGTNTVYKQMLTFGIPAALAVFVIALFMQGKGSSIVSLLLFALTGLLAGGLIVLPITYMKDRDKRVVLTECELRVEEKGHSQSAKYSDIQDVKFNGKQIQIKLKEVKIDIAHVHGYPVNDIYEQLEKKRPKK